jgi:hypothetical protein
MIAISSIPMTRRYLSSAVVTARRPKGEQAEMKTEFGTGSYPAWSPPAAASHPRLSHLEVVCWFAAIGLSLTALGFALGYAESIGQALAMAG